MKIKLWLGACVLLLGLLALTVSERTWQTAVAIVMGPSQCLEKEHRYKVQSCFFDKEFNSVYQVQSIGHQPQVGCVYNLKIIDSGSMEGPIDARIDIPEAGDLLWKQISHVDNSTQFEGKRCPPASLKAEE